MGLAVRKEILLRRGILATPTPRRPGHVLTPGDKSDLDSMMARLQRRLAA